LIGTKNQDVLETLIKIQFHHNILNLTNPKLWTNWQVHFKEIEVEYACDPDAQLCDSILIFESMLTRVSLPLLDPLSEPILILISIDFEIEPPLLDVTF